jgi:hypothetical protein
MSWWVTRLGILAVLGLGAGALAWAQASNQFAYVEVRETNGPSQQLKWRATSDTTTSTVHLSGAGAELELALPHGVTPGTQLEVPARLEVGNQHVNGSLKLDVQESSTFLSGRLQGHLGAWELSGGLRVRRGFDAGSDVVAAR